MHFLARKANSAEIFTKEDLVPAIAVSEHLEVLAKIGHIPLRVQEGFILKKGHRWYLAECPPEDMHIPPNMGRSRAYYVVDRGVIVCP